jgi:ribonuclease HI
MPKHNITLNSIMSPVIWKLYMDESFNIHKYGVGIILIILMGKYGLHFKFIFSNNMIEYKALSANLNLIKDFNDHPLQVYSDSLLIVGQYK